MTHMATFASNTCLLLFLASCQLFLCGSGDYVWVGKEGWRWQDDSKSLFKNNLMSGEGTVRRSTQNFGTDSGTEGSGDEGPDSDMERESSGDLDDEDSEEGSGVVEDLDDLPPSLILDPITEITPDPVEFEDSGVSEIPLIVSADSGRVTVEWMPPLDGDISLDSSDSLKLSWDFPNSWRQAQTGPSVAVDGQGYGVLGYQILYAPSGSWDQPSARVVVNTKEREFLLSSLDTGKRYTLRVSAEFERKSSMKEELDPALSFTNRPLKMNYTVPAPRNCRISKVDEWTVNLEWMAPLGWGFVSDYQLGMRDINFPEDSFRFQPVLNSTWHKHKTAINLVLMPRYIFKVVAINSTNLDSKSFNNLPACEIVRPALPPRDFFAEALNSSSLSVILVKVTQSWDTSWDVLRYEVGNIALSSDQLFHLGHLCTNFNLAPPSLPIDSGGEEREHGPDQS